MCSVEERIVTHKNWCIGNFWKISFGLSEKQNAPNFPFFGPEMWEKSIFYWKLKFRNFKLSTKSPTLPLPLIDSSIKLCRKKIKQKKTFPKTLFFSQKNIKLAKKSTHRHFVLGNLSLDPGQYQTRQRVFADQAHLLFGLMQYLNLNRWQLQEWSRLR